jgi:hypothetical protein
LLARTERARPEDNLKRGPKSNDATTEKLATTDVVHELLQATLHAYLAIQQRDTAPVDWVLVEAELRAALAAAGHPAGA